MTSKRLPGLYAADRVAEAQPPVNVTTSDGIMATDLEHVFAISSCCGYK